MQGDLFSDVPISKKKRTETWEVTFHACKHCMGTILRRNISPTKIEVMCAECGVRSYGNEAVLCWCGKTAGIHGKIFFCTPNHNPRPELPNLILVMEKKVEIKPPEIKPDRRVHCPDSF